MENTKQQLRTEVRRLELLAPAQNKDCALCAINYGADSIYIGANLFGARKNASNPLSDIEEIINYAHKFGVKVYITLNTILDNPELDTAGKLINKLHSMHADGIIFQDMAILNMALNGKLPDIKLIASTQCDNRNLEKVKFFENTGVGRVILARELSLTQIKEICSKTSIEIETFVHGALCVSYSGQCYLSHKIGGRSANKGECAKACRKKYTLIDGNEKVLAKDKYLLSLKDFMAADRLEELVDAGVTSFKIEGRLKDANYIKNTVLFYRRLLDGIIEKKNRARNGSCIVYQKSSSGEIFPDFEPDPKKSFNRDFCEYFLSGKRSNTENPPAKESMKDNTKSTGAKIWNFDTPNSNGEYIGRVDKIGKNYFTLAAKNGHFPEICPQDGLCFFKTINSKTGVKDGTLNGILVNSFKDGKIFPNIMPAILPGTKIYKNKDAKFDAILKKSKTERKLGIWFKIYDGYIECKDEDKNSTRLEFDTSKTAKSHDTAKKSWISSLKKTGNSNFYVQNIEFLTDNIYFLPASKINELRRKILDELMSLRIKNYTTEKQEKIRIAKYPLPEGDYRLNVHNNEAKIFYEKCGCKVLESSFESGRKPFKNNAANTVANEFIEQKIPVQKIPACKKAELMRTKHCIRYALNMCLKKQDLKKYQNSSKEPELYLQDEKGQKYHLFFDCKNCEMVIMEN